MASKDTPDPTPERPLRPRAEPPTVLVIGAASRDVVDDDPRGWRLGGAVTYCSLTLARLGFRVRALVGADRAAAAASELDLLRDAGVELAVVGLPTGPVFDNIEGEHGRTQLCLAVSAALDREHLPIGWETSDAMFAGPVAGELGDSWSDLAASTPYLALGWQGLLRELEEGKVVRKVAPGRSPLVAAAQLVGLSRGDVVPETEIADLVTPLRPGATLALTDGRHGGLLVDAASPLRLRRYPAIPPDGVVDPTGAGDVFLATLMAARLAPGRLGGPPRKGGDARLAAAAASLAIERPGLLGVPSLGAVLRRAARATGVGAATRD